MTYKVLKDNYIYYYIGEVNECFIVIIDTPIFNGYVGEIPKVIGRSYDFHSFQSDDEFEYFTFYEGVSDLKKEIITQDEFKSKYKSAFSMFNSIITQL